MKQIKNSLLIIVLVFGTYTSCRTQSRDTPNLIIIQTDEHNFRTLGCYRDYLRHDQAHMWGEGNLVETPNIDFLAKNGVLFTKFYAAAPVCSPSRGSFISGVYPQNNGVPKNDVPLNDDVITYAMILQQKGYKTGFMGKWHLDGTGKPQWEPKRKFGFEDNKYMFNRGHWKKIEDGPNGPRIAARNKEGKPSYFLKNADEKSYTTDFLIDRGIDFIAKNKHHPFSLYISLPDPHGPDRIRPPYDNMYQHMKFKAPVTYNKPEEGVPSWAKQARKAGLDQSQYFGMVKCIDDNIGKLISFLRKHELLEHTIIVFTSDHGDLRGEHHKHNKGNPLEASAKIPFIVYYPKKIPPASVVKNAFNTVDFSPTLLRFMGFDVPESMKGRDFSEILTDPSKQEAWEDIAFMRNGGTAENGQWVAAVTSRYKLVISKQDDPWLIDMNTDPHELTNFFRNAAYKKIAMDLAMQLKHYADTHADPFLAGTKMATDLDKISTGKF
ncbi:MAG: sulfatase [Bacteroidota bacterium]